MNAFSVVPPARRRAQRTVRAIARSLLALAALSFAAGCGAGGGMRDAQAPSYSRGDSDSYGPAEAPGGAPAPPAEPAGADEPRPPGPGAPQPGSPGAKAAKELDPDAEKVAESVAAMLIYTADLRVQVEKKEFAEKIDAVANLGESLGGYLSSHSDVDVVVRVPSARFRDALRGIEKLGIVTSRSVHAEDVSEEYNDLEVRLKSLRATRDRLQEFLKQAKSIQEVLQVEQELGRLNQQIDQIEGRLRFLASRAALSTITVHFDPKPSTVIVGDPEHPPPPPPPRTITLPIEWLPRVGLPQLLRLDAPRD